MPPYQVHTDNADIILILELGARAIEQVYVGESESEVRKIFSRARINSPCIIFFDEVRVFV